MWLSGSMRQLFLLAQSLTLGEGVHVDDLPDFPSGLVVGPAVLTGASVAQLNAAGRSLTGTVVALDIDGPRGGSFGYRVLSAPLLLRAPACSH